MDTAGPDCAACIYDGTKDAVVAEKTEHIGKGHAERLMGIVSETMAEAGIAYQDLERIITTTGPGSFTGIRVSIATAKGFGLGLAIPVVGIGNLHGLLEQLRRWTESSGQASIGAIKDARRGELYAMLDFDTPFAPANAPFMAETTEFAAMLADTHSARHGVVLGYQNACPPGLGENNTTVKLMAVDSVPIAVYARLGAECNRDAFPPEPVYLRRPDATPQRGFAVERTG
ncbi:tRNA (adenosine(37)-N6)-threonylcarbamoyltransferase complex dimerization subunit type 1 TsaB [Salaquimonas pukyongi]|uniref:tRNA (adenosine(37)-N6)-threonylcarbamoyltransferase complex dimerization subunit type 1 TsaB n=1 Tax=Salaquimonas pukyongi TaxID=2712698 RepID=UPI0013BEA6DE|nr:tRNA (adenosine(37)-N6)-threonylcarbamoyltransferase complex dimerization subunit type 1 TsaB [Salaquimonas pukyongi]